MRFVGYDTMETDACILEMHLIDRLKAGRALADDASQGQEAYVITDVTPFYGESGGQVGDTGTMTFFKGNS